MNAELHKNLIAEVCKLKKIVSELHIEDVINLVATEQRNFAHRSTGDVYLSSPLRQGMYLIAIACAQPEPQAGKAIDDGKHDQIVKALNSIFNKYALAYFPSKEEQIEGLSDKWRNDRRVAMPAFISYFASGFKVSTTQIKSWIRLYFDGFEGPISDKFGITHHEMLDVADYFESKISSNFKSLVDDFKKIEEHRQNFIRKSEENIESAFNDIRENNELKALFENVPNKMNGVYAIELLDIEKKFGAHITESIINNFTTIRGNSNEITYITDDNPVSLRPIVSVDGKKLYFVVNNSFYQSIINNVENLLTKHEVAKSFLRIRDKRLEDSTVGIFKTLIPSNAEFYESVFETNTSHHEHDSVIIHDGNLLIIEAKASPPKEPFRDPSKAFVRINNHFKSESGIQKAYDQAEHLRKNLIKNKVVNLYNKKGEHLREIRVEEVNNIYCICITRDDFGALATDLTLLLEKEIDCSYPWAVNISDLETMINGFIHLGKSYDDFYSYLDQRVLLHGKVFGIDELEYAGAFLNYNGLNKFIEENADFIPLDIRESDVFDEIYMAELEGVKHNLVTKDPIFSSIDRNKLFGPKKTNGNAIKKKAKAIKKMINKSKKINRKK